MSKYTKKQKVAVALGAGALAVAGTGTALAFWTADGSGDGTATTQSTNSSLTVNQTAAPTNMAPGVAAGAIKATVTNGGTSTAHVSQVTVSILSVTGGVGSCSAADYDLLNPVMTIPAEDVAPTATSSVFSGATLGFHNTTSNQDGCKGATVNLHYTTP